MAKHYKIKYKKGSSVIHFDGIFQPGDVSLCGADLMGDQLLGWEQGTETNNKVTCIACIRIYNYCIKISEKEIGREKANAEYR